MTLGLYHQEVLRDEAIELDPCAIVHLNKSTKKTFFDPV